jgi:hypothetical protein
MRQHVTFKRPDGKECGGYLVEPSAGAAAPGVVVIQVSAPQLSVCGFPL